MDRIDELLTLAKANTCVSYADINHTVPLVNYIVVCPYCKCDNKVRETACFCICYMCKNKWTIKKPDSDDLAFNTKDDILTKSADINFNNNYIIALNGINRVVRVEEMDGNYVIYHDNKSGYRNRYVALVVRKIGPNPKFILATPKRDYLNE